MKNIFYAVCLIALMTSPVYGAGSANGLITLADGTGGGPGVLNVAISANSYANYSGAATAGGYGGAQGQVMAACAASLKADEDIALYIGVRASMDPADTDDNGVYQLPAAGTTVTQALVDGYILATNFNTAWLLRGGSL